VAYANDFKPMMVVALIALPPIFLLKRAKAQAGEAAIRTVCAFCSQGSITCLAT
jgi:hypothetical protein